MFKQLGIAVITCSFLAGFVFTTASATSSASTSTSLSLAGHRKGTQQPIVGGRANGRSPASTSTLPPDFSVVAGPQSVTLPASSSTKFNVTATALNGFTGTITASFTGLPIGVTASPATFTLVPGIATQIKLTAGSPVASAVVPVTVRADSGRVSHTTQLQLSTGAPADYTITTSNDNLSLVADGSQSITVRCTTSNSFSGPISGSISGLPIGVTASPSTFSLADNSNQVVTFSASASAALGNTPLNIVATSGSIIHNRSVMLNIGSGPQDFLLSTTATRNIEPGGSANVYVNAGPINGFAGSVQVKISGLPNGVSATPSSFTVGVDRTSSGGTTVVLSANSSIAAATTSFNIVGTSGALSHQNTVVLTTAPDNTAAAIVHTTSHGTVFPAYFIGFSMGVENLSNFMGTGATTNPSFINLLSNLKDYVGSPSIRTAVPRTSSSVAQLAALKTGATFTVHGRTTSPHFFFTTASRYDLSSTATFVQATIKALGDTNITGIELDNEPDRYIIDKYRNANWDYTDYLAEAASFAATLAPYTTKLIPTGAATPAWDRGLPALHQQLGSSFVAYTAHDYAENGCPGSTPTSSGLVNDANSHVFYGRFAPTVRTLAPIPVRAGEMNTATCGGALGVSNVFAASLWLIDTAFELKSAGAAGFNIHSVGAAKGPSPYDLAWNDGGKMNVYAPFYGILFFAQAIQNERRCSQ